eukprot:TRINITY_DN128_c0_g2_i2.p2 TRINITY_DN128_c0_g2~~TRINITY_DN128_c0_g2_i2.p2  ORF type:complete len:192 (+),score=63.36 TRINITY_DN128_c0_g2_i2:424-999(+)
MGGHMSFRESFGKRLDLIRPTRAMISTFLRDPDAHIQLSPNSHKLISALQQAGVDIYLISGGLRIIVEKIADLVQIPHDRVFSNTLFFNDRGEYVGFDEEFPTANTNGKGLIIEGLRRTYGYKQVVMVGDGITDLEAKPYADLFIGYGGNVQRDRVKAEADWFITDFQQLYDEIVGKANLIKGGKKKVDGL